MTVKRSILIILFICLGFCNVVTGADEKKDVERYITKVSPILTNVQVAARNISQRFWSPDAAGKQMQEYINNLRALVPPESLTRQHRMLILALEKMKRGFYELAAGNRPFSVTLVRSSSELFRIAVREMVDFAKKEGIIKNTDKGEGE